ncbi:TVP38/TMEM64 family protein [Maritimibacter sp. DP1N21-5]|uniref:TVP38/TMEM64 family protein n=1 Tax=Maritimibacter sp. DP1N21-5 TaxID=2836867 RepID=UPI001C457B0A|nr:VTT domain-containing protein [Maritimibacter sp. DP1N21-5]MBV7408164.1 VTT domain-containing protein [Maritimibacter sp. DP1N21-5]
MSERLKRSLPLILIVLAAAVGFVLLRDRLTFEALAENREALIAYRDAHYLPAVLVFVATYTGIVGLSLPGATIATLTGGFLFGLFPGVVYNVLAASMGATIIFSAAKAGAGERLAARMDVGAGRMARLKRGLDRNQWSVLFLMRLAPVVPFFVANVLPAFMGVPLWRFVVTTVIGIIPGALVYTSVGSGLGTVFETEGTPDLSVIFDPAILGPIVGLCALAALPMLIRVFRKEPAL